MGRTPQAVKRVRYDMIQLYYTSPPHKLETLKQEDPAPKDRTLPLLQSLKCPYNSNQGFVRHGFNVGLKFKGS